MGSVPRHLSHEMALVGAKSFLDDFFKTSLGLPIISDSAFFADDIYDVYRATEKFLFFRLAYQGWCLEHTTIWALLFEVAKTHGKVGPAQAAHS